MTCYFTVDNTEILFLEKILQIFKRVDVELIASMMEILAVQVASALKVMSSALVGWIPLKTHAVK